jgi:hypothetical protein
MDSTLASTPDSTAADRDEQLNAEFRPLTCRECATTVRVRKRSPHQTSVQWQSDTATHCPYLAKQKPSAPLMEGCPALSETIRAAVEAGLIPTGTQPAAGTQLSPGTQFSPGPQ